GTPVFAEPTSKSPRLGTLVAGTRLRSRIHSPDETCPEGYLALDRGFICGRHVRPTAREPHAEPQPVMKKGALLPHRYAFVKIDGALAHQRVEDYFDGIAAFALGKGYGVVVK